MLARPKSAIVLALGVYVAGSTFAHPSHADSGQLIGAAAGLTAGASMAPGGATLEGRYLYEMSDDATFEGRARFIYGGKGQACGAARCDQGPLSGHATQLDVGVRLALSPPAHVVPWVRPTLGLRSQRHVNADVTGLAVPLGVALGATMGYRDNLRLTAEVGIDVAYVWLTAPASNGTSFSTSATVGLVFLLN